MDKTDILKKLLDAASPGPWEVTDLHSNYRMTVLRRNDGQADVNMFVSADAQLAAFAPTLARQVIAAHKLAEAMERIAENDPPSPEWDGPLGVRAIRIAASAALDEWKATQ